MLKSNLYHRLKILSDETAFLNEDIEAPSEKLLQAIWQHQRLRRRNVKDVNGQTVRFLHPGYLNKESGPDFKNAIIQFGKDKPVIGDIEIDVVPENWQLHKHHKNPEYSNVVLHIVWDSTQNFKTELPTIILKQLLDSPLHKLKETLTFEIEESPQILAGSCASVFKELNSENINIILKEAGIMRLEAKAQLFIARATHSNWTQILWEWLFRALGYKNNIWAMQSIAEMLPLVMEPVDGGLPKQKHIEARLFGLSGLLPADIKRDSRSENIYLRELWHYWWRDVNFFSNCIMPRSIWKLSGVRPNNHPQRRLALASKWLSDGQFVQKIYHWFNSTDDNASEDSLLRILSSGYDDTEFWAKHYTLSSKEISSPKPMIGRARATDIAINVLLPWFAAQAIAENNNRNLEKVIAIYSRWSSTEDNAVLKMARNRFFTGVNVKIERLAIVQQGLIQILQDFCKRSDLLCSHCKFPALLKKFSEQLRQPEK